MKKDSDDVLCPLCLHEHVDPFFQDNHRPYLSCPHCRLVFVPSHFWLSSDDEKAVYDLHENSADDPGYRRFLSRLSSPLLERLAPHQRGLDFGCGPGPALPEIFREHGHHMDTYDPYYRNDSSVFQKTYDFICTTEVAEHLHNPDKEFESLFAMLRPKGWLGIMTKLVIDRDAFSRWHYIRDMTHICFYSRVSFLYLGKRFQARPTFIDNDVILLQKM